MASIGSVDYDDETTGYQTGGAWVRSVEFGEAEYEVDFPSAPGVDGTGSKNYGYRRQNVTIGVTYVAGSANECISLAQQDNLDMAGLPNDASIGGVGLTAAWLTKFKTSTPRSTGYGTYRMNAEITVLATRLNA